MFSKGRQIRVQLSEPEKVADDVVSLYSEKARQVDIELTHICDEKILPAPMDYEGMHERIGWNWTGIINNSKNCA